MDLDQKVFHPLAFLSSCIHSTKLCFPALFQRARLCVIFLILDGSFLANAMGIDALLADDSNELFIFHIIVEKMISSIYLRRKVLFHAESEGTCILLLLDSHSCRA